jgi:16S rRNA (cytidine1402-2'-O)-methyltransferase
MFDLVKTMLESRHVAIVSDAGMPCISDPGWKMVRMIRETMPDLPIEVVGGPSATDIMLTIAKGTTSDGSLSGRFEGFASPLVSNITEESMAYSKSLQLSKEKDFSIHFINSKKLKKNVHALQRIYGE